MYAVFKIIFPFSPAVKSRTIFMKEIEKNPNFYRLLLLQLITSVFKIHNM